MNIEFYINGYNAKTEYGISLSDTALEALMTPPPMKERVSNKSRLQNGTRVIANTSIEKYDERTINLPVHICAKNEADFIEKYTKFKNNVLKNGHLLLRVVLPSKEELSFNTYYQSCNSYKQFYGGIAKYVLRLHEPNPAND